MVAQGMFKFGWNSNFVTNDTDLTHNKTLSSHKVDDISASCDAIVNM